MKRKIIQIDQEKCNGCGLCVQACHERAIEIFEHKARLIKEEYCDGLGDCLPHCPMDAIRIEVREVAPLENHNSKEKLSSELKQWPVQIKLIPPILRMLIFYLQPAVLPMPMLIFTRSL